MPGARLGAPGSPSGRRGDSAWLQSCPARARARSAIMPWRGLRAVALACGETTARPAPASLPRASAGRAYEARCAWRPTAPRRRTRALAASAMGSGVDPQAGSHSRCPAGGVHEAEDGHEREPRGSHGRWTAEGGVSAPSTTEMTRARRAPGRAGTIPPRCRPRHRAIDPPCAGRSGGPCWGPARPPFLPPPFLPLHLTGEIAILCAGTHRARSTIASPCGWSESPAGEQ
jgi:hypothetical protein